MAEAKWVRILVAGRENGIRSRIRRRLGLGRGARRSDESAAVARPAAAAPVASGVVVGGDKPLEPPRDLTPPDGFEVVLHRDALGPGELTEVIIAGTAIAVARVGDNYYALANTCPHAGGPLGDGLLEGETIRCPYHGWGFDVRTGECRTNPSERVDRFELRVVGEAICVRV